MEPMEPTGSSGKSPEELVLELTHAQRSLTEALQRLIRFQRQTLVLKRAAGMDAALDSMETLLLEVIDFAYASLQYRSDAGLFTPIRAISPENIHLDYPLMEWVMGTQEVSVLPIDFPTEGGRLRSQLFLPFGAHHLMLLWLEQPTEAFTQEQEALLSVLAREMASVLDSHHFRMRLEKTRDAMTDIIESVPLGLLALDHEGRILMINSTAGAALDIDRAAAAGQEYAAALPRKLSELIDSAEKGAAAEEIELPLDRPDGGAPQYLGVTISPVRSEDGSSKTGQVVVCRDLQLSHEVKKLRELDAMKNDFLSLVTHELRTPLTSIMAYSETLMMDPNESVPPDWREYIGTIHSEGKRLSRLIDDVLDMTRMGSGQMQYTFEQADPNEIVGTVVMSLTAAFEEKGHELDLDLDETVGQCRLASDRFLQVLQTIVSNAIKYTNPGGRIVIATRRETPPGGGAHLLVTVEDNGIGIAPEHLETVFSKFGMVEAVKNHTAGSGLGMAICKQIIEDGHGGKIWLESEVGKGTKVFVRVPLQP